MNVPPLERLSALVTSLQSAWAQLFESELRLSVQQDSAVSVSVPVLRQQMVLAWLNTDVPPERASAAAGLLRTWAGLSGQMLAESEIAESLTQELITAWNRQAFLNGVIALMRTTTDAAEGSINSLRLAAQVLRAESAFLARNTRDGLQAEWIGPDILGDGIRLAVAALRDQGGLVSSNDPDECGRLLRGATGVRSFLGQQCDTHDAAGLFVGVINHALGKFNAGDVQMFESLVEIIKTFAEINALNLQQKEAEKVDRDLRIAAEFQASFAPSDLPPLGDYDLAVAMIPATRLGGDFYDVVACGPDRLMLVVADVAGKGISAALLAAELRAVTRAVISEGLSPDKALERVNAHLFGDMERSERFSTAMLVSVPMSGSELSYASAGHTTALHLRDATSMVSQLPSASLPLGIVPTLESHSAPIAFAPRDVLCLYSDGLTEAEDPAGRLFGLRRVAQVLMALRRAPAHLIVKGLIDSARQHRQSAPQIDDLTLVALKKTAADGPSPLYQDHLHLAADLAVLPRVGQRLAVIRDYLPRTESVDKWLLEVELAITEAASNIIRHAYRDLAGEVDGLVTLFPDKLEIDLVDSGAPYPVRAPKRRKVGAENLPEGGYGLGIIYSVMDAVDYQRLPDGFNLLRMSRAIVL